MGEAIDLGPVARMAVARTGVARSAEERRGLRRLAIAHKRERILEAASAVIHARGYEAATLDMIAERLNVTKPYLYTYFRNKGDILAAVCEAGVAESLAALDRVADAEGSAVDRLRAALAETARIIIDRHGHIVVYQREMMSLGRADAQRLIRLRHEYDLRIGRMIDACVADGHAAVPAAAAMSVWVGGLLSWITFVYRPDSRRTRDSIVDEVVTACMRIVGLDRPRSDHEHEGR